MVYNPAGVPAGTDTIPVVTFNVGTVAPDETGTAGVITEITTLSTVADPAAPPLNVSFVNTFPTLATPDID
jgi:hypothetical protein